MKKIELLGFNYEIVENIEDCFKIEEVAERVTDYFLEYDYIFGDYSYEKLRLKGFCDASNEISNKINDIKVLQMYIDEFCSYGARYFLLKKIK